MPICYARHGQTDWNCANKMMAQGDIPLNETGRAEALELAMRACALGIERILSSDLCRCTETAQIVGKRLGVATIETSPLLREVDMGQWVGATPQQVLQPEDGTDVLAHLCRVDPARAAPGGESPLAFLARVKEALAWIRQEVDPKQQVLVVTHGGVLRALHGGCTIESLSVSFNAGNCQIVTTDQ